MFNIASKPTYTAQVTVTLPGERAGKQFEVTFNRLSQTEIENLMTRAREGTITDNEFVREILTGWQGVSDEHGDLEFCETNLTRVLEVYPVAA